MTDTTALEARLRKVQHRQRGSDVTWETINPTALETEAADALAAMRGELEAERMRLAACGVAAMQDTAATVADRITPDNPYWSASYGDVCRQIDALMALRAEVEALRKDAERYRYLRNTPPWNCAVVIIGPDNMLDDEVFYCQEQLDAAIDAALSPATTGGPESVTDSIDSPQPPLE